MPLSVKTRYWLAKRAHDWPFTERKVQDTFASDLAEWLILAQLYQQPLERDVPVPTIAELGDTVCARIEDASDPTAIKARQIQDQIIKRLNAGESFSDLILLGCVYQFWHEKKQRPTVAEIAAKMGLSRPAFYRRYTRTDVYKALIVACGRVGVHLPHPNGLNSVQRASRKAKRRGPDKADQPTANRWAGRRDR